MPRALLKLRVGLLARGPRDRDTRRRAPLKVRSETQYLQAYLSLAAHLTLFPAPVQPFPSSRLRYRRRSVLFISELKSRIIQAVLSASAKSAREIFVVLNPQHRP